MTFQLNDDQSRILNDYQYGYAVVRAVPGAGKTTLLSYLAVSSVPRLKPGQRILIVTYTRSAALNALRRIESLVHPNDIPLFVAKTLHGFASDILSLYDRTYAEKRLYDDVEILLRYQEAFRTFALKEPALYNSFKQHTESNDKDIPDLVRNFVRVVRQNHLDIDENLAGFESRFFFFEDDHPFADIFRFIVGVYRQYLGIKKNESAYDYDDIVLDALHLLRENADARERLSEQYGFIFEDEAQDSTHAQSVILEMIAGPTGNWVRIGDENQAILSTFTASRHDTLTRFIETHPHTRVYTLSKSPRYNPSQIDRINALVDWFAGNGSRHIAKSFAGVHLIHGGQPEESSLNRFKKVILEDEEKEKEFIVNTALAYISRADKSISCGILCPTNRQVEELYHLFQKRLGSQTPTYVSIVGGSPYGLRMYIEALYAVCDFMHKPTADKQIRQVLSLIDHSLIAGNEREIVKSLSMRLQGESTNLKTPSEAERQAFLILKDLLQARLFSPIDFVLFVSEKLPALRKSPYRDYRSWIVQNLYDHRLRFDPFLNPLSLKEAIKQIAKRGKNIEEDLTRLSAAPIQISTVHRAKGLEFDLVFLTSADTRHYPLTESEIEESVAKESEALKMMYAVIGNIGNMRRTELIALEKARLLYVALSRAKHGVIVTTKKDAPFATPFVEIAFEEIDQNRREEFRKGVSF